jgi:hypothetical protein
VARVYSVSRFVPGTGEPRMAVKRFVDLDPAATREILRSLDRSEQLKVLAQLDLIEASRRLPAATEVVVSDFKGARVSVVRVAGVRLYFLECHGVASLRHVAHGRESSKAEQKTLGRLRLIMGRDS